MKVFFIFLLYAVTTLANAAGPLFVEGANSTTPVRYPNPAIVMNFDLDMIENHTNTETDALVLNAFNLWNNLLTSTVNLTQGPDLPEKAGPRYPRRARGGHNGSVGVARGEAGRGKAAD